MKKVSVLFDFLRLSIPLKITKGRNVVTEMTENPSFPTPDVPLEELAEVNGLLEARFIAASNGGREESILLRQAVGIWDDRMRKEARYVERIADGDEAILVSSGFSITKQPAPALRPEFSVEPGQRSGSVILRRQAVKGAKAYVWQLCLNNLPEDEDGWKVAQVSGKASVELNDLMPVTKYWFRVAAVMPQETAAYNSPIMHVVV